MVRNVSVKMPEGLVERIDDKVANDAQFSSRSAAIKYYIRHGMAMDNIDKREENEE